MSSDEELIDDLNTLNQIGDTLNRAVDVQGALNNALARLIDLMGLETGWIFIIDPASQERWAGRGFRLAAHYHLPESLAIDNPKAWDKDCDCQFLCQKGELEQAYNEVRCSRLSDVPNKKDNLVIHASTPLHSGRDILGILNVGAPDWSSFTPRSLALLSNIGNQMGIAMERARLFDMLHEQRIDEQAILLEISNQLLSRPDLDEVINYLVNKVTQLLQVDACALLLPEDDPEFLCFRAAAGWQSDPVFNHYRIPADEGTAAGLVMRTQQVLSSEANKRAEIPPVMREWQEAEGFQETALVPLLAGGVSIGVLIIDSRESRQFEKSELRFLQLMANQTAIAIETARLHQDEVERQQLERELAVSRQIQLSMLPRAFPTVPGWDFAAVYEAAQQVGGDFYDCFILHDRPGYLAMIIADVSGKGVPAALFMAQSRTTLRNTIHHAISPANTFLKVNHLLQEDNPTCMFLTAFYALLDTKDGKIIYSNAGHNRPLMWQENSKQLLQLTTPGIALGILQDIELEEKESIMKPGDTLIFYTDGVTEAINGAFDEYGEKRLKEALFGLLSADPDSNPQTVVEHLKKDVRQFTDGTPQSDDFTLFVLKRGHS